MTEAWRPDLLAPSVEGLEAGPDAVAFNACVALCDRHAGDGRVGLRWLSAQGHSQEITFDTLLDRAGRFANILAARGIVAGDRVAGLIPRVPDLLTVILGTLRAGAVYQPLFTAFGPKAIASRVQVSRPRLVVTDEANRPKLGGLPYPVLSIDATDDGASLADNLANADPDFPPVMVSGADPLFMMFTSGTTGTPKGVMVPVHMLRATASYMRYGLDVRPDDHFWNLADPGWAYGLYYGVIGPLLMGNACTLSEAAFSVERSYAVIERFGITNLAGAPTAYRQMVASPLEPPRGVRVISSAGETLDPETAQRLADSFGAPARDHFGQTELGMVLCDHHGLDHPRRPGTIGFALPGFRAAVVSRDGVACPSGEPGLLAVDRRSPLFWFGGYWGSTDAPFVGDYYLTGDSACEDPDGLFRFAGREDDVITSSGYRIGPAEVENALMEHPAVLETAVIGKPDPVRTEIVKAFVVARDGYPPSDALGDELSLFVKQRLAAHAYPREISFVAELPKTPSGKVQRFMLRATEAVRQIKEAEA